jgi:hypothetical protein
MLKPSKEREAGDYGEAMKRFKEDPLAFGPGGRRESAARKALEEERVKKARQEANR